LPPRSIAAARALDLKLAPWLGAALAAVGVAPAATQSLPAYDVSARVEAIGGGIPGAGDVVRVELGYIDPATGRATSARLQPIAFLRTLKPGQGDCATAVRAYSLNKGVFRDASSLTGRLIVSSNADATLSFVDPLSDLASANIFEVVQLPEPALQIAVYAGDVAALLPRSGSVVLADASGTVRTLATGLKGLSRLVVAGPVLLAVAQHSLMAFDTSGRTLFRQEMPAAILDVVPLANGQSGEPGGTGLAVLDAAGRVVLVDALDGKAQDPPDAGIVARHIAGNGSGLLIAGSTETLSVLYPGGGRASLSLGFVPGGLAADGIGLHGFVWSQDGTKAAVIDMVRGAVADSFGLSAKPSQALFSGRSLFVSHASDANITLIDTGPISPEGGAVAIRTYEIESREPGPTPMTVHDPESGWIIALPRGLSSANVYGNGNPTAPMTTTALRGSMATAALSLDRSFRRTDDGRYSAIGRLPAAGPVQLVTIADEYRTIRCFDVDSTAPTPAPEPRLTLTADPPPAAGHTFTARLVVENAPVGRDAPKALRVTVRDLFGNSESVIAGRQPDGSYVFSMKIAAPGQYPVSAEYDGIPHPALLTVGGDS
jgi:hypothetical protein